MRIRQTTQPWLIPPSEAVSLYKKKWHQQRRLLEVDFVTQARFIDNIVRHARTWEDHMGLRFRFGGSEPDILISLEQSSGSWSYIGTDSKYYASRGRPSMNFGWFDETIDDAEFSRTTLHEFSHALSLVHEHSSQVHQIDWNRSAVYAYYARQGWEQDSVNEQIFKKYELSQINGTEYDRESIMHYPIPPQFVQDRADVVGWNQTLSEQDKCFIAKLYPPATSGLPHRASPPDP
jgi:serralysin